jgi:hypothetical protein
MSMRRHGGRNLHMLVILLYFAGVVVNATSDTTLGQIVADSVMLTRIEDDKNLWGHLPRVDQDGIEAELETNEFSAVDETPMPTTLPCDINSIEIDSATPAPVRRMLLAHPPPTVHLTLHDIPDTVMAGIHYNYIRLDVTAPDGLSLHPESFIRNNSIKWTYSASSMPLIDDNDAWVYSCLSPAGVSGIFEDDMRIADIFEEAVADRCVEAVDFCTSFLAKLDYLTDSGHLIAPLGVDVFNHDVLKRDITLYVHMDLDVLDLDGLVHTYSITTDVPLSPQSVVYQCPGDVLHFEKASDVISVATVDAKSAVESLLKFEYTGNKSFFDSTIGEDSHIHLDSLFIFNFLNNQEAHEEISERVASDTLFLVTPSSDGAHFDVVLNTTNMRSVCERVTASADYAQLGCLYREILHNDMVVHDFKESVRLLKDTSDTEDIKPWLMNNFLASTTANIELADKFVSSLAQEQIGRSHRVILIDPGMRWDADKVKERVSMVQRSDTVICVVVASVMSDVKEQRTPVRRLLAFSKPPRPSQRVMSELRLHMHARRHTAVVYNDTNQPHKRGNMQLVDARRRIVSRLYNRGRSLLGTCTRFSKICDMQEWLEKFNHMKATALRGDAKGSSHERRLLADEGHLEQQDTLIEALIPLETSHSLSSMRQVNPDVQSAVNLAYLAGVGSARWHMVNMTLRFQHDAARKPLTEVLRDIGGALRLHKNVFGVGVRDVTVASARLFDASHSEGRRRLLQVESVNFQGEVVLELATVMKLDASLGGNLVFAQLIYCIATSAAGTSELTFVDEPTAALDACIAGSTSETAITDGEAAAVTLLDTACGTAQQADADCNSMIGAMLLVGTTLAVDWSAIAMSTHPAVIYFTATTPQAYALVNMPWYTWVLRNAVKSALAITNLDHIVVQTEDLHNFEDVYFEDSDLRGTFIRVWVFADPLSWPDDDSTANTAAKRKIAWNEAAGWKSVLNNAAGLNLKFSGETFEAMTTFARPLLPSAKEFAVVYDWQLRCFYPTDADDDADPCIVSTVVMAELEATLKLRIEPLRALAKHVNINYISYDNNPGHESTSTMRFVLQVTTKEHAHELQDALNWFRGDINSRFEETIRNVFPDVEFTIKPALSSERPPVPWIMIDGSIDYTRAPPWILPTHWLVIIIINAVLILLCCLNTCARTSTRQSMLPAGKHVNTAIQKMADPRGSYKAAGVHATMGVNPSAGDGDAFQKKRMSLMIPPNML